MKNINSYLNEHQFNDSDNYEHQFNDLVKQCTEQLSNIKVNIRSNYDTRLYERYQVIVFDFLDKKDWPNSIFENSVYLRFSFDLLTNMMEITSSGSIYLSKYDQEKSYLCMNSLKKIQLAVGKKWIRRQKIDVSKISSFVNSVFETINSSTIGYPYKQMNINIY